MSTQSIKEITIQELKDGIDKSIIYLGNSFILESDLGVKAKVNKKDLFSLLYYKKLLNQRYCRQELNDITITQLNKIITKYT